MGIDLLLPLSSAETVSARQAIAFDHELSETTSFGVWRVALESFQISGYPPPLQP